MDPPGTLWTIGHSTRSIEELIALLRAHDIEHVADVRRFAGSRKHPHTNPEPLAASLAEAGIGYTAFPALGGRRMPRPDSPHGAWRNVNFRGYADYMDTEEFAEATRALAELARRERTAIMCSEGVWWRCHRSMIADWFAAGRWTVLHIMSAGRATPHPGTAVAQIVGGTLLY